MDNWNRNIIDNRQVIHVDPNMQAGQQSVNRQISQEGKCAGLDQQIRMIQKQNAKKKKQKVRGVLGGFLAGVLVTGCAVLAYHFLVKMPNDKEYLLRKYIDHYYLEDVEDAVLQEGVYKGIVDALGDPYSEYFTLEENTVHTQSYEGSYKGIGVLLQQEPETGIVTIVSCYDGSPAQEAGIMDGDILHMVNGKLVSEQELTDAVAVIKSAGDEGVDLTLIREGASDYIEVNVVPNDVIYPSVSHEMLEDEIGYLAISEFKDPTYQQFHEALEDLKSQGMKGLIVDLRNNTGGLLYSVNDILNDILPKGTIVYTVDKYGNRQDYTGEGKDPLTIPMVVMVNEYTASASEIFAGAVRDYDMAKLVGTTTFGKGVVQSTFQLDDGSGIKLTIANYYTPKGTNIHGTGLEPDEVVELDLTPQKDGSYKDNQLDKGIEVLKDMM